MLIDPLKYPYTIYYPFKGEIYSVGKIIKKNKLYIFIDTLFTNKRIYSDLDLNNVKDIITEYYGTKHYTIGKLEEIGKI